MTAGNQPRGRRINNAGIEDRMLALDVALRACWDEFNEIMPDPLHEQVKAALGLREFTATPIDPRCAHTFPLPSWMGPDQDDPCRCDLPAGHDGRHECGHLRDEKAR